MILIVFGLPGTGKTYFSRHLEEDIEAIHLNTDIVRKKAGLQGRYDKKTKEKVYNLLLKEVTVKVSENHDVIVDGTFQKKEIRDNFWDMAKRLKQQVFFIEIKAKDETVKQRMKSERDYSEADYQVYLKIKNNFETLSEPHLILWSDQTNVNEMLKKAKAYIYE